MIKDLYLLLDIDGVVGKAPWEHLVNWKDHSMLTDCLAKQSQAGCRFVITFITDRPCGNLELICYTYHATATDQIGESGGAAFDPLRKWQWPNPDFENFRQNIRPDLVATLSAALRLDHDRYQPEMGGRLVTVGVVPADPQIQNEIYQKALSALDLKPYRHLVRHEIGKVLVIYPRQLNKQTALEWHEQLYHQKHGQVYPWDKAIWVADGVRDIVAAQYASQKGAQVAAVGNAAFEYKNVVQKLGGIVVKEEYEAGLRQILDSYMSQI